MFCSIQITYVTNIVPGHSFDTLGMIVDTHTGSTMDLKTPHDLMTKVSYFHIRSEINRDEMNLIGIVSRENAELMEYISELDELKGEDNLLYTWRQDGPIFTLWNSKRFGRHILEIFLMPRNMICIYIDKRRVGLRPFKVEGS